MIFRIASVFACGVLTLVACKTEPAPQEAPTVASRSVQSAELPEIRYYMIADT